MKNRIVYIVLIFVLTMVVIIHGEIPQLINYQGYLTNNQGDPIHGNRTIRFRIFDSPIQGNLLWVELQEVNIQEGLFHVLLGSMNPIPYVIFQDTAAYLEIKVGSDPAMEPRKKLVSVGYAYYANKADSLDGYNSPDFIRDVNGVRPEAGGIDLIPGSNVVISPDNSSHTITISATGGGGGGDGDITAVYDGTGLSGGGETGDVTLSLDESYTDGLYVNETGPESISGSASVAMFTGTNSGTGNGVRGEHSSSGHYGYMGNTNYGAVGSTGGSTYGYLGGDSYGAYGIHGTSNNYGYFGGTAYGAYGKYNSNGNYGYLGGSSYGVYGKHNNNGNYGFLGDDVYGVYGKDSGTNSWGALGTSSGVGVHGDGQYFGGQFDNDVVVFGSLSKTTGSFMIDHPLDPQNKYLFHSFVESPDMMNVYNGNVVLDGNGEATVNLPDYFQTLNRDFRYQLTAIGAPGPNLYVAQKISNNRFKISGGSSGMEVSWQVTGIRQDAYAKAHRIQVEVEKTGNQKGTYIHPLEHGMPESLGLDYEESIKIKKKIREIEEENRKMEAAMLKIEEAHYKIKEEEQRIKNK